MDKSDLLAEFKTQLELFEKYQTFIDKARTYSDRFNPAVVAKVISDNTERIQEVAAVLDPLVPDVEGVIRGLEGEKSATLGGAETARMQVEELELRLAIGELGDADFAAAADGLKATIAEADQIAAMLDDEIASFRSTLDRWLSSRPAPSEGVDVALGEPEEEEGVALESEEEEVEEDLLAGGDETRGDGIHAERSEAADDVSPVFDTGAHPQAEAAPSFEAEEPVLEVPGVETAESGGGHPVLIQNEGTSDEVVNHFDNDALTIGRGRENNVQVKNDSKVSRYHCKLYRKGGGYYIQDNKSANGTLVDGELITEKRLFGGEEIIIGETPFRFRVLV